jgi:hypothetical protein
MVGHDLPGHADALSETLQAIFDVDSSTVGRDAQVENNDLMMLQGSRVILEVVQRSPKDQQAFLLTDADGVVEDPHPVVPGWHRSAQQEKATAKQPGADGLVVGQAQGQYAAQEIDEAEQDLADTAQADVGVEIPEQAEADDQKRVAMAFRCRQVSRGDSPAASACLRQDPPTGSSSRVCSSRARRVAISWD